MASLVFGPSELIIISGKYLKVYDLRSGDEQQIENKFYKTISNQQSGSKQNEDGTENILAASVSPSGKLCAVGDDRKQLSLWKTGNPWTHLSTRTIARRVTGLTFTGCEETVLAADKSGDVHSYSTSQAQNEAQLLLGHVSMLLDVKLCNKDQYIVSADRDEKIRVSHYPNAYNIQSFCLGHTDFVSRLCYIEDENLLLSASGDGTIRLWNYQTGHQVDCVQCSEHVPTEVKSSAHIFQETQMDEASSLTAEKENQEGDADQVEGGDPGSSDGGDTWRTRAKTTTDVKCLSYCPKHRTVVVGFDCSSHVLTYRLTMDTTPKLVQKQLISLNSALWDLGFDTRGRLWLLQQTPSDTLQLYDWTEDDSQVKLRQVPEPECENAMKILLSVNSNWEYFKDLPSNTSIFPVLHKARIDNMKDYIEKKQKRMAEQKQAKKHTPPSECTESNNPSGANVDTPSTGEANGIQQQPKKSKTS